MSAKIKVSAVSCKSLGMIECPRCWHWSYSMNFDSLCNRCVAILLKYHPKHESIALINENLELRGMKPEDNPEWDNV